MATSSSVLSSTTLRLVLGSSSFSRRMVMERAGYTFTTESADIDEKAIRTADLYALPETLAKAKADAIVPKLTEPALLVTSDTVIVFTGKEAGSTPEIREKPETFDVAVDFLRGYSDHTLDCVSGLCVTNTATGKRVSSTSTVVVDFLPFPDSFYAAVRETPAFLKAAGGLVVEHPVFEPYVKDMRASETHPSPYGVDTMNSVMGIDLTHLEALLKQAIET